MSFLITSFCVVVVVCLHFEQICFWSFVSSVYIARIHIHSPTAPKHERDTLQQEILLDGYLHHGLISIPPFTYFVPSSPPFTSLFFIDTSQGDATVRTNLLIIFMAFALLFAAVHCYLSTLFFASGWLRHFSISTLLTTLLLFLLL